MSQPDRVSEGRAVHRWKPIEDLPADLSALNRATAEVAGIRRAWATKKKELEDSGALKEFNERLCRQWCIETGILEGIYTLDRGATQTLIEHGFDAALLSHGETNIGEAALIQILRDHERAIEGLFAFVKQDQPLSTSYVRQLHQVLVAHQDHVDVLDGQGRPSRMQLRKGDWKLLPNNPGDPRTLELVHEYSPPEEVAAEMDRLVAIHAGHDAVEAEISAAWLHHRFVQVHPFSDGNGRVARSLATLVLIQKGGFPFVVLRDDKNAYIDALRAADDGDLLPFVEFVCRLQKKAILNAIDQATHALKGTSTRDAILAEARDKLRSTASKDDVLRRVTRNLHASAAKRFVKAEKHVAEALRDIPGTHVEIRRSDKAGRLGTVYPDAIRRTARAHGYDAGIAPNSPWICLAIEQRESPAEGRFSASARLAELFVSLHHLSSIDSGIAAANAFILLGNEKAWTACDPLTSEPFIFTAERFSGDVAAEFDRWVDRAIDKGLELWRRSL